TIKARLENRFYRRPEAILFDVAAIEANALEYNEEGSEIVKRARIVTTVLRRFISDPDCYDPMPIYTEIVADLEEFMRSFEAAAARRQNGAQRMLNGHASGEAAAAFQPRRSTRDRRAAKRPSMFSEDSDNADSNHHNSYRHSRHSSRLISRT